MTDDLIKRLKMWVDTCDSNDLLEGACPDISLAADALEALQSRLEAARELVQRIMARLADLLESDNFNNIEAMVVEAGVPYPASVPALAEEGEEDERDDSPYCECGNFPTEEEEASNRCACCGKKFDP